MRHLFKILALASALVATKAAMANDVSTGIVMLAVIDKGDTIPFEQLPIHIVYPDPLIILGSKATDSEIRKYWRMVRDVKKTLPYAKEIAMEVKAIDDATKTMSENQRKAYMKDHEDDLVDKFKPRLKKLSLRQGKILIKLVDRQCGQSSYELIKAYRGGFRAAFWQGFAKMLGADLKSDYNSKDEKLLEYVINYVENGQI